jgi:hypothetical protein
MEQVLFIINIMTVLTSRDSCSLSFFVGVGVEEEGNMVFGWAHELIFKLNLHVAAKRNSLHISFVRYSIQETQGLMAGHTD